MYKSVKIVFVVFCFLIIGTSQVFANGEYAAPAGQENEIFNTKLGRIEDHSSKVPQGQEVSDVINSMTQQKTYTINCPATDTTPARQVVVNVNTHSAAWDQARVNNAGLTGAAGACFAEVSNPGFVNNVKTVNIDFYIMLNPSVTQPDEAGGAMGQLADEGLMYHEMLHAQLLINAIQNSAEWQQKVCSCQVDLGPMDISHNTIYGWVVNYMNAIAPSGTTLKVVSPPKKKAKDSSGNFDIDLGSLDDLIGDKEEYSINWITPDGSNVQNVNVTVVDGHVKLTGQLINAANPGYVFVRIDPDSTYAIIGIETPITIEPETGCTGLPAAPSDLSVTNKAGNLVDLGWTDNSTNESGFKIERKEEGGSYNQMATADADATTYTDTVPSADSTYYYRIRAYNDCGDSDYSNEAEAAGTPDTSGDGDDGDDDGDSGGGCFIATAAYGDASAKQVAALMEFRDTYLLSNTPGRAFVRIYYTISPPVAELISSNESLRTMTRFCLAPVLGFCYSFLKFGPVISLSIPIFVLVLPTFIFYLHRRKRAAGVV